MSLKTPAGAAFGTGTGPAGPPESKADIAKDKAHMAASDDLAQAVKDATAKNVDKNQVKNEISKFDKDAIASGADGSKLQAAEKSLLDATGEPNHGAQFQKAVEDLASAAKVGDPFKPNQAVALHSPFDK